MKKRRAAKEKRFFDIVEILKLPKQEEYLIQNAERNRKRKRRGRERGTESIFGVVCITYRNGKRMQVQKASSLVYIIIPLAC